jgi:ribosomal protein S18 acetylase RimI-like enzyme
MERNEVVIEHGLPEALREQAVVLFEEAFGAKMRVAVPDRQRRMAFMARAYRARNAIVARRGEELLGMAGLSTAGEPYRGGLVDAAWDFRPYVDLLGWAGAAWAVWGLRLGDHSPKPDEVYLDGLAVAPSARGLGIGTRLLAEVNGTARRHGKRFVRLDVIDTNPRAQALYERVGYRVTRVQSFRWKQRRFGFGAMISMEQPVVPAATSDTQATARAGSPGATSTGADEAGADEAL